MSMKEHKNIYIINDSLLSIIFRRLCCKWVGRSHGLCDPHGYIETHASWFPDQTTPFEQEIGWRGWDLYIVCRVQLDKNKCTKSFFGRWTSFMDTRYRFLLFPNAVDFWLSVHQTPLKPPLAPQVPKMSSRGYSCICDSLLIQVMSCIILPFFHLFLCLSSIFYRVYFLAVSTPISSWDFKTIRIFVQIEIAK